MTKLALVTSLLILSSCGTMPGVHEEDRGIIGIGMVGHEISNVLVPQKFILKTAVTVTDAINKGRAQ